RRFSIFDQPIGQPSDALVVFGMHHYQNAFAPSKFQNGQHLVVPQLETLVSEENLDRGASLLDQRGQLRGQDLGAGTADEEGKSIVNLRLWAGRPMIVIDYPPQRLPAHLHGKRKD